MQSKLSHETATLCERAADCTATGRLRKHRRAEPAPTALFLVINQENTMKTTSIAHLASIALVGTLSACSPSGRTAMEGTAQADGVLRETAALPARSEFQGGRSEGQAGDGERPAAQLAPKTKGKQQATAKAAGSSADDADWTMTIEPDATVQIRHKGITVVQSAFVSWAEKTKQSPSGEWVPSSFKAENVRGGQAKLSVAIPKLDVQGSGAIRRVADNELRVDYRLKVAKAHHDIKGTLIDWRFNLKPPTFTGKTADPVFLENSTGWIWPVGPNESIVVRFDKPLARIIYEANNKNNIRTYFYADNVEAGETRLSYTVRLPDGGQVAPSMEERYGSFDTTRWFRDALAWNDSPVDLSFLNANDKPAGCHGLIKAKGDQLVFENRSASAVLGHNLGRQRPLFHPAGQYRPAGTPNGPVRLQPDPDPSVRCTMGHAQHLPG